MSTPFDRLAEEHRAALPGFLRTALLDHGISSEVVERRGLGWDGGVVTVPVRDAEGHVVFFERWDPMAIGHPLQPDAPVELYAGDALRPVPRQLIVAEGVHEALVFESHGFASVAATGSGLVFKVREWGPLLGRVPEVLLAYRRGERRGRGKHALSRAGVFARATRFLPRARRLEWPEEVGDDGGAYAFFVELGRSNEELERLPRW